MDNGLLLKVAEQLKLHGKNAFHMGTFITLDQEKMVERIQNKNIEVMEVTYSESDTIGDTSFDIEWLEGIDEVERYNHHSFDHTLKAKPFVMIKEGLCNTTGCVAGWVLLVDNDFMFDQNFLEVYSNEDFCETAQTLLDINFEEAQNLFYCGTGSVWQLIAHEYDLGYEKYCENFSFTGEFGENSWASWLYSKITSDIAATVITQVANEEIILDGYQGNACFAWQIEEEDFYNEEEE